MILLVVLTKTNILQLTIRYDLFFRVISQFSYSIRDDDASANCGLVICVNPSNENLGGVFASYKIFCP